MTGGTVPQQDCSHLSPGLNPQPINRFRGLGSKTLFELHFVYRLRSRTTSAVLACRCCSDLVMMVSFGDGKERNTQQFDSLFAAAGWRLLRITPTSGVFMVVEAEPL